MKKHFFAYLPFICIFLGCQNENLTSSLNKYPFFSWGFSVEGFPITEKSLELLEQETKIYPQLIQFYMQWPATLNEYKSIIPSLNAIIDKGAIPCLTWEPMTTVDNQEIMIPYNQILEGHYDTYLIQMANEIKVCNNHLIIRFAHEMNLERYHWGGSIEQFNEKSPHHYVQMFRYVFNVFQRHQVKDVLWAFCPNVDSVPNHPWNIPSAYYPGDDYVDLLGMDGYNWDITLDIAKEKKQSWTKPWVTFEELFKSLYHELKQIAPSKPILVFETGSVDRKGGEKSKWIKEAIQTAKKWNLLGIIWFQIKKEEDWRLNQYNDFSYVSFIRSEINPIQEWIKQDLRENNPTQ